MEFQDFEELCRGGSAFRNLDCDPDLVLPIQVPGSISALPARIQSLWDLLSPHRPWTAVDLVSRRAIAGPKITHTFPQRAEESRCSVQSITYIPSANNCSYGEVVEQEAKRAVLTGMSQTQGPETQVRSGV